MAERFTIFGGSGFIGSAITHELQARGHAVSCITRTSWPEPGADLGHVIFTIGMTADFRKRLIETAELQVVRAHEALTRYRFSSFLYLSSTRVYAAASSTFEETPLLVRPSDPDHIYNISKLAAESLCLAHDNPRIRVARLSNVYGAADRSNLFMTAVLRDAVERGHVEIGQASTSAKDYAHVTDVARALADIALKGQARLYNVATGQNTSHQDIADILRARGANVTFRPGGPEVSFPRIEVSRFEKEFGIRLQSVAEALPMVFDTCAERRVSS